MKRLEVAPPQRHKGNDQPKVEGKWYTRASALPKAIDDASGLAKWAEKKVAEGLVNNPYLIDAAQGLAPDDYRWGNIAAEAKDLAGSSDAAEYGSVVHKATEIIDAGKIPTGPADVIADAQAYKACCEALELKPLAAEVFVADGTLKVAGSFDRLVECPDGKARILDIKTIKRGKDAEYASRWNGVKYSIQLAVYANSKPYCGTRGFVEWSEIGLPEPATDRAIVFAIPRGSGECQPIDIDLEEGYELAQLAVRVREARKRRPATPQLPQQQLTTEEG